MALPKPVSRADMYLSYLNYTKGLTLANLPKPVSRADMYLYNLCINRGIGGGSGGSNVTLNGEPQTNFNFIENKVVQDGLVEIIEERNTSKSTGQNLTTWFLNFDGISSNFANMSSDKVWYMFGQNINLHLNSNYMVLSTAQGKAIIPHSETGIEINKYFNLKVFRNGKDLTLKVNNKHIYFYDVSQANGKTLVVGHHAVDNYDNEGLASGSFSAQVYTRELNQQEIAHNFSVLNNTQAIKKLHTTDSTGKTSILKWATDSTHVDMQTGRTLEEEYTSLLSRFGKEFTSADGSTIEVNNAIPSKVLSTEIKGNTQLFKRAKGSQDEWIVIPNDEGRDTVVFEYKLDSTQAIISNNGQSYPIYESTIQGKTRILDTDTGLVPTDPLLPPLKDGDVLDLATKTITFANKSTQVLTDEQVKAYSKYKKVILLGGVGGVYNTLEIKDDGGVVYTQNIKEIVLDNNINCTLTNSYSSENHLFFNISAQDIKMVSDYRVQGIICDRFKWEEFASFASKDYEFICGNNVNAKVGIKIAKAKLESPTVEGFKKWLQNNPVTVQYQLETPIITHIPKELVPTILTQQTNILEVGGKVKASSFKVTLPVDAIGELRAEINEIKKQLGAVAALQLGQIN